MSQTYGIEAPRDDGAAPASEQPPARYLVLIDHAGSRVARLYLDDRTQVAEFFAGADEVVQMIDGVAPAGDASGSDWDEALSAQSADERAAAEVYVLAV